MLRKQRNLRIKQAIKISTACLICVLVNFLLHLPTTLNFFSVLSVFVLYSKFAEDIYAKTFERLLGIVGVSAISALMLYLFGEHLLIYWAVVLLVLFVSGSLAHFNHGYIFIAGSIAGSMIMLQAIDHSASQALFTIFLANIQILLAWLVILIVEYFLPFYNKSNLLATIRFVRQSHLRYLLSFERYGYNRLSRVKEHEFALLEQHLKRCRDLTFAQRKYFRQVVSLLESLLYEFRILKTAYLNVLDSQLFSCYHELLNNLFYHLRQQLLQLPSSLSLQRGFDQAFQQFSQTLTEDKATGRWQATPSQQQIQLLALQSVIRQIHGLFKHGVSKQLLATAMPVSEAKIQKKLSWMTGLRLMFVIAVILLGKYFLHWQAVLQMTIAAIIMSIQPNFGRSVALMKQRFIGVVLGAAVAVAIFLLLHHVPNIILYLSLLFISLAAFAYLALSETDLAYIGMQAGLIIPLVLMGHNIDQGNLPLALTRLLGVLQGSVIGAAAILLFAPKFPLRIYRYHSQQLLKRYIEFFSGMLAKSANQFSHRFIFTINQALLEARNSISDVAQLLPRSSVVKRKINQLIPVFLGINLHIRVINMLLIDQSVCQQNLQRLKPVCLQLRELFAMAANTDWTNKVSKATQANQQASQQALYQQAKLTEVVLQQQIEVFVQEQQSGQLSFKQLTEVSLFITAFSYIASAMKQYALVISSV